MKQMTKIRKNKCFLCLWVLVLFNAFRTNAYAYETDAVEAYSMEMAMEAEHAMPEDAGAADEKELGNAKMGDVDGDKIVGFADVELVLRHAMHMEEIQEELLPLADADGDGSISMQDAYLILKAALIIEPDERTVTVAKQGGDFQTIQDALEYAQGNCSKENRMKIFIYGGVYHEEILLADNPGIDMEGCGMYSTVVEYPSAYPNSPILTTGQGTFSNLGFCSLEGSSSYALHYEVGDTNVTGTTTFESCNFWCHGGACVGAGLGAGTTLRLSGCVLDTGADVCLYFHNSYRSDQTNQHFIMENSTLTGTGSGGVHIIMDDSCTMWGMTNSQMEVTFVNTRTEVPGSFFFRVSNEQTVNHIPLEHPNIRLSSESYGNDIAALNWASQ